MRHSIRNRDIIQRYAEFDNFELLMQDETDAQAAVESLVADIRAGTYGDVPDEEEIEQIAGVALRMLELAGYAPDPLGDPILTRSGAYRVFHKSETAAPEVFTDPEPWYFEPADAPQTEVFSPGYRTSGEALAAAETWEAENEAISEGGDA